MKGRIATFAFIFLFTLLVAPLAMGFEFDNKKYYDADKKEVTVKNSF